MHGFFSVPVDHLSAIAELAQHYAGTDLTNTVVVSPDLGNAKPATQFARLLGVGVAAASKQRLADDTVVIESIVGDVRGKDVIVLDDEIATAGSVCELLDVLATHGVRRVSLACTHGLFTSPALERLCARDDIAEVVTTNTVPQAGHYGLPNLGVRSIAPAVRRDDPTDPRRRVGQQPLLCAGDARLTQWAPRHHGAAHGALGDRAVDRLHGQAVDL